MLSIHTNLASLSTQNALGSTQKDLTTSMTRLGTGFRVNSAMDDAAGLQIATRLNAQTRGMQVAQRNTQNGISMLQTAEGALSEVSNILLRMKDLATEGANGTSTAADKTAMQSEYDALGKELTNIMKNTAFGGQSLFGVGTNAAAVTGGTSTLGKTGGINFQIGSSATEVMNVDVSATVAALTSDAGDLGAVSTAYKTVSVAGTEVGATATITALNTALDSVGAVRSALGASANRLDHVFNNLGNMVQNVSAAKGRIMDVDYATESSNMTAKQMLMQASTAMLKQSSSMSQMVASLLQ
ncbi:MAG TPA: flagellin [Rhizobacter sp.]|nr:flagellin [Rhizobacter sp.]